MTAHHLKLWQWSMTCAEAEVVKECANRMQMDEDPWQALLDACRMADEIGGG